MDQAEAQLGKPILLEEFGKRLVKGADAQLFADAIDHLRNPVFQTTMDLIASAIQACVYPRLVRLLPHIDQQFRARLNGRYARDRYVCFHVLCPDAACIARPCPL